MSQKIKSLRGILLVLVLAFCIQSCGRIGDDDPLNDDLQSSLVSGVAVTILKSYCGHVESCGLQEFKDCHRQFLSLSSLDEALGLSGTEFKDFRDIIISETRGEIVANSSIAKSCQSHLKSVSCEEVSRGVSGNTWNIVEITDLIHLFCADMYVN